jgi:hypothetical protein
VPVNVRGGENCDSGGSAQSVDSWIGVVAGLVAEATRSIVERTPSL